MEAGGELQGLEIIPRWADEQGTGRFGQHSIDHMEIGAAAMQRNVASERKRTNESSRNKYKD